MHVVTRFPPSPTGFFHIGSARTALFNYLFAASEGGTMYLRFEDTDRERSKKEYEEDILAGLDWLGISYSLASPLRQSEKTDEYRSHLHALIEKGFAYEAEEAEGGGGKVIRFKNPNVRITFPDLIRGEVSFDTTELKDFVIARNADSPLYHLTVVVDDRDQGVTHVIRGEDHVSNTQRQILILEALGFERPHYAHMPLILAPDKSKLSKRHGAISVNEYRAQGYLPEALVNYLALLGWNPGTEQEIFSLPELIKQFDLAKIHKSGAIFDIEKLRWLNRQHMSRMDQGHFVDEVLRRVPSWNKPMAEKIIQLIRERISVWSDLDAVKDELDFFFNEPSPDPSKIPGKGSDAKTAKKHLAEIRKLLEATLRDEMMTSEGIKDILWGYAEAEGKGAVLWPMRYALTGRERSPDPFTVAAIIGKDTSLNRIDTARRALE